MMNQDPLMDDEQVGEAVAKYLEENPELLQGIVPAHDLWPAIENRISARVIPISTAPVRTPRRSLGWIPMLIAASALVAASAGITYVLTQAVQSQPSQTAVAHDDVPVDDTDDSPAITHKKRPMAQLASHPGGSETDEMRKTYDSEIMMLHAALEARRGQLNQSTVAIIEQNLRVIDEAIRQSKEALAKDPNSRLLNDQLDRSLAKKTGLLRAAALLPAA